MRRTTCCRPVGEGCGDLHFDPTCAACLVAARLVKLVDLRHSIRLRPDPGMSAPYFFRSHPGRWIGHPDREMYGEVLAELVGVDRLPLQDVLNSLVRIPMNLARAIVVWSHGERVRWREIGPQRLV